MSEQFQQCRTAEEFASFRRTAEATHQSPRCYGISSNALAAYALGRGPAPRTPGTPDTPNGRSWRGEETGRDHPHDESDLAACELTYLLAPDNLRERMLPVLESFRAWVRDGINHHGVQVIDRAADRERARQRHEASLARLEVRGRLRSEHRVDMPTVAVPPAATPTAGGQTAEGAPPVGQSEETPAAENQAPVAQGEATESGSTDPEDEDIDGEFLCPTLKGVQVDQFVSVDMDIPVRAADGSSSARITVETSVDISLAEWLEDRWGQYLDDPTPAAALNRALEDLHGIFVDGTDAWLSLPAGWTDRHSEYLELDLRPAEGIYARFATLFAERLERRSVEIVQCEGQLALALGAEV